MKIDKELLELGITESILEIFHSNTNNKEYTIISAKKSAWNYGSRDGNVVVNLELKTAYGTTKSVQYNINLAKIRQKQINRILNDKIKLDQI
jgi:hypothetical protein